MTETAKTELPRERYDIYAMRVTRRAVTRLTGSHAPPAAAELPVVADLPLIVTPGRDVQFEDQYFHLDEEGLYRFVNWGKVRYEHPLGRPEIIDARQSSAAVIAYQEDILALLGAVAVLTVHGHTHDVASHQERLARMKLGGVALTCGSIAQFMCTLLAEMGWRTRMVHCTRIEGVYDTYDCGHLLFEFYWPRHGKWVLADVDTHQMFVKDGAYLNMAEVKELVDNGRPLTLEPLTLPGLGVVDTTEAVTTDFTGMALFDHILLDTESLKQWYRLMFAAVSLGDEGVYYCPDAQGRKRIAMYYPAAPFLDKGDWLNKYYGNGA